MRSLASPAVAEKLTANRIVTSTPHTRPCKVIAHAVPAAKTKASSVQTQSERRTIREQPRASDDDEVSPKKRGSQFYVYITGFPFPLGPAFVRNTIRYEVVKDTMWTFEQTQALENVNVYTPVRMTVIRLKSGGLWVHSPVAPTEECVRLVKELGPVEYIVLSTFAYEHKAFVGPFSREFPKAEVWVTPFQWSFPLNLPSQFFGIFPEGELTMDEGGMPWEDEIAQRLLLPPSIGIGNYARQGECAFLHKASKTLLVTDAVMYLDDQVPEIIPKQALLASARDGWLNRFRAGNRTPAEIKAIAKTEPAEDTEQNRIRGWRRMSLLVLYFNPFNLLEPDESFEAISNRLIVPPVVETLVYSKFRGTIREWVDTITSDWSFTRVIPAHFRGPVQTNPAEFKRAFAFAYEGVEEPEAEVPAATGPAAFFTSLFSGLKGASPEKTKLTRPVDFPEGDIKTLRTLNDILVKTGVVKVL